MAALTETASRVLFVNGWFWDGVSDQRRRGEVLVQGKRIEAVAESGGLSREGATLVDALGATLIPALVEAHGHLPFPVPLTYNTQIDDTPIEELVLTTVHHARLMLDMGFTGVIGAGSPRLRVELAVRNEINAGRLPGPRMLASTPTLTTTGGLNDTGLVHSGRSPAAMVADGPIEMRKAVRLGAREGVDVVKANLSGDDFVFRPAGRTPTMCDDEVAAIAETARMHNLMLVAHARATASIKQALRCGFDIIHHADFCDTEALDMFEARKDSVFTTPSLGFLHGLRFDAEAFGINAQMRAAMGLEAHLEANVRTHIELRKRGIRQLIGGDYGIVWQPHGSNARDIEHLVNYLGYRPVEALRCATVYGFQAMGLGHELGLIKPGYIADLVLVQGDPTEDVRLLQDRAKLLAVMKDGSLHKAPAATVS